MTLPGKTQHNSHCSYSPKNGASVRRRAPVEGAHYDNFAAFEKRYCVQTSVCGARSRGRNVTLFHSGTRLASPTSATQPARDVPPDTALRSAVALAVRSTVSREGVCSWANRARCPLAGLGEHEEQSFFESRRAQTHLDLVSRASRCGPTSPRPFSPSAPAAASARPTSTSAAIESLRMKHSWSCSTSFVRASGLNNSDGGVESRHAHGPHGEACDLTPWETAPDHKELGAGVAPGPSEAISPTPERKITASPRQLIAVVGTDGAASARASLPSYLLAHGDPASVQGGEQGRLFARTTGDNSVSDGNFTRSLPSGEIEPSVMLVYLPSESKSQSESNQRQDQSAGLPKAPVRLRSVPIDWVVSRRGCRGAVCARGDEPRATILVGWSSPVAHQAHNLEVGGSNPSPATSSRGDESHRAPARGAYLGRSAERSAPRDPFSSGDGLGIQQPGSNTLATRAKVKGQSGRARDRAMCPAVARFSQGRAA